MRYLLIFLIIVPSLTFAQNALFDDTVRLTGELTDQVNDIVVDSEGKVIVTGQFNSEKLFLFDSSVIVGNAGGFDAFIARFDPDLSILWLLPMAGEGTVTIHESVVDNDAFILSIGYSSSDAIIIGADTLSGFAKSSFVTKVSPDGQLVWVKRIYADYGNLNLSDLVIGDDNDLFVLGSVIDPKAEDSNYEPAVFYEDIMMYSNYSEGTYYNYEIFPRSFVIRVSEFGDLLNTSNLIKNHMNAIDVRGSKVIVGGGGFTADPPYEDFYKIQIRDYTLNWIKGWQFYDHMNPRINDIKIVSDTSAIVSSEEFGVFGIDISLPSGRLKFDRGILDNIGVTENVVKSYKLSVKDDVAFIHLSNRLVKYELTSGSVSWSLPMEDSVQLVEYFENSSGGFLAINYTDNGTSDIAILKLNGVNEWPEINMSNLTIKENLPHNTYVATIEVSDPENDELISTISGQDSDKFYLRNDSLFTNYVFNYESREDYYFMLWVDDQRGGKVSKRINIIIEDMNDSIQIKSFETSLIENCGSIARLKYGDPDETDSAILVIDHSVFDNDIFTWTLNYENKFLAINPKNCLNFEEKSEYHVNFEIGDKGGVLIEIDTILSITDANDAPSEIVLNNTDVVEHEPINTLVGFLSTKDEDSNDTHSYKWSNASDNQNFILSSNAIYTNKEFDYNTKSAYQIKVTSKDEHGASITEIIEIRIVSELIALGVSPNPSLNFLNISGLNGKYTKLDILTLQGQVLATFDSYNRNDLEVNLAGYSTGIYLLKAYEKNGDIVVKKFKIGL